MRRAALLPLLVLLFVLSGAAGLLYEAVWSRYLSLFVGHSAYAQVITLVIFLGGLGVGALAVSRRSAGLKDPLLAYGFVEAVIGVIGLVFHDAIYQPATRFAYDTLFPAIGGGPLLLVVKWGVAGALILPQSILLGATFPLMTAGALRRRPDQPGRLLSVLYFANSLGAAAGVLIAGFWLYAAAGLPGTLSAAALLNFVAGIGAALASLIWPTAPMVSDAAPPLTARRAPLTEGLGLPALTRLLVLLAAGTAIASFIYEVAWIRMLSMVLGSSTHAFELMLSAFILGLALGALWIRRHADRLTNPLRTLVIVQLAMGALAMASLPLYLESFDWTAALLSAVARTPSGYTAFTLARYGLCLAIMLPATFCAGMTLPLMTRMLYSAGAGERAIGTVYGANTLGSIVGVAFAGLVLLPVLGLKGTLVFGASLDMLLGLLVAGALVAAGQPVRRLLTAGAGLLVGCAALALLFVPWNQQLLASGVFRVGSVTTRSDREIDYHDDGRTATVHVTRFKASGARVIATNGKPDGSLTSAWYQQCGALMPRPFPGDDGTQALLALLTLAHAPEARLGAVIGHGTGMSSHFLLGSPVMQELVTIEIEPAMVRGARRFYPANARVFDDPRSRVVYDDARAWFAASSRRVDLVLSEPSNPWVSGVSGLFTTEFYAQVKRFLAPGAVFGQWLQTYEINDGLMIGVLAGLHEVFSDYRVYLLNSADLLVVATAEGRLRRPDWSVFESPAIQSDLCRFAPTPDWALDRLAILDRAHLAPLFARGIRPNSDFYPLLDLGAERARFLNERGRGFTGLGTSLLSYVERDTAVVDPPTEGATAIDNVASVLAVKQALSLRRDLREKTDRAWTMGTGNTERYLMRAWVTQTESGQVPGSWRGWTNDFWTVFRALHADPLGPDTLFFSLADRHARGLSAPRPVLEAISLAHALVRGDFPAASASARVLLAEAHAGRIWLPADDLLDGAVLSLAADGQVEEAREAFETLISSSTRPAMDLRLILLNAYIERSREGVGGTVHD